MFLFAGALHLTTPDELLQLVASRPEEHWQVRSQDCVANQCAAATFFLATLLQSHLAALPTRQPLLPSFAAWHAMPTRAQISFPLVQLAS